MRDLRGGHPPARPGRRQRRDQDALADLFRRFGASDIEHWSASTWEAFALQALWRVCRDGVHGVKARPPRPAAGPPPRPAPGSDRARTSTASSMRC